jgi:methyl-accepting chemotaxis protein
VPNIRAGSGEPASREGVGLPRSVAGGGTPLGFHVLVGVGSMLVLLAVGVVIGILLAINIRHATNVADRHVDYANAVDLAALTAKAMANDERGYLISGDRQFVEQIRERTAIARAAFEEAERTASGNAQRRPLTDASQGFERWLDAVNAEIAIFRAGKRKQAVTTSLGPTRTTRKTYEADLTRAQELGNSLVEDATSSVSDESWRAVRILLVYLVIALALGFLVTAWVVRALRPVYTLAQRYTEAQAREMQLVR